MSRIEQSPLLYLQKQVGGDFFAQWKSLSEPDKAILRLWAQEEIDFINGLN